VVQVPEVKTAARASVPITAITMAFVPLDTAFVTMEERYVDTNKLIFKLNVDTNI
jgi:hypothetical protein